MNSELKTIVSKTYISFLIRTEGEYLCCVLPRCDAFTLKEAIKESYKHGTVGFETPVMYVDVMNANGTCILDCLVKNNPEDYFQIAYPFADQFIEKLEQAIQTGLEEFGPIQEFANSWARFHAIAG